MAVLAEKSIWCSDNCFVLNFNSTCLVFSWFVPDYCWSLPAPLLRAEQRRLRAKPQNFSHLISLRADELTVVTAPSKVSIAIEERARLSWMRGFYWLELRTGTVSLQSLFKQKFSADRWGRRGWWQGQHPNLRFQTNSWRSPTCSPGSLDRLQLLIFQECGGYFKIILVNLFFFFSREEKNLFLLEVFFFWYIDFFFSLWMLNSPAAF